jgi:excisionase family DNA binding protein
MYDLAACDDPEPSPGGREAALRSGLRKRSAGVPTYSVPEAAALLSVSREHLYRLIRIGAFPALRMGSAAEYRRYIVAAHTVEALLDGVPSIGELLAVQTTEAASEARVAVDGGR